MNFKYILLIAIISGYSNSIVSQNIGSSELLQKIVESRPILNFFSKEIPKKVKKEYKKKYKLSLNLSDSGSPYNKTDVIYKDEPWGMLLFSGTVTNDVGFFLFEAKGITSQCYFVYYSLKGNTVAHMETITLNKQPRNFEDLRQALINKEYF